jgi:hypothetical protein
VGAAEKVAHRLGEIPQRLLLHRLRPRGQPLVFGAGRGQLSAQLGITRRAATRLPVLLLLDRQVPNIPGVATVFGQQHRLLGSRKQPVSRHPCKLAVTTDIFSDMRAFRLYDGPTEVHKYAIARQVLRAV